MAGQQQPGSGGRSATTSPAAPPPLLQELWRTGAWRLFPLLLVYMSGESRVLQLRIPLLSHPRRLRCKMAQTAPPAVSRLSPTCRTPPAAALPAGITLLIPHVPGIMTDYFAGRRAGRPGDLHCEFLPADAPRIDADACRVGAACTRAGQ